MVFSRALPVPDALDALQPISRVRVWAGDRPPTDAQLADLCRSAHALVCMATDRIDGALIRKAKSLRVVVNYAVGHDNIDLEALTSAGIAAGYTPGVLTETTADLTWALILAVARRIVEASAFVRHGDWERVSYDLFLGQDLQGATLGVVGLGAIGQAVARRARGFRMRVVYTGRETRPIWGARRLPLDELLRVADVVTLHTPLTPETTGLIGEQELGLMKSTAVLINASRGKVVDQAALTRALEAGRIGGAGLDVTADEPIDPNDPLLRLPNCIVLPHIGSATLAARRRMARLVVDNVRAGLAGERLPACLNPEIYEPAHQPGGVTRA